MIHYNRKSGKTGERPWHPLCEEKEPLARARRWWKRIFRTKQTTSAKVSNIKTHESAGNGPGCIKRSGERWKGRMSGNPSIRPAPLHLMTLPYEHWPQKAGKEICWNRQQFSLPGLVPYNLCRKRKNKNKEYTLNNIFPNKKLDSICPNKHTNSKLLNTQMRFLF